MKAARQSRNHRSADILVRRFLARRLADKRRVKFGHSGLVNLKGCQRVAGGRRGLWGRRPPGNGAGDVLHPGRGARPAFEPARADQGAALAPLPGCSLSDAAFRWSFPPCPERPPATLWQPCGLASASEFSRKCPNSSPLLLWRRGLGRGGRHAGKPLLPLSAIAFLPLSPTLSLRSAGGEREKPPVAVSRCAYKNVRAPALLRWRVISQPAPACHAHFW